MSRKLDGKAMSPAVTTIILASTILATVLVAYTQMTGVLMAQSQHLEFQQAERALTSLADIIENSIYSPGSSGYVSFEYTSARPNLVETGLTATLRIVSAEDPDVDHSLSIPVNIVQIEGGFLVSTSWKVVNSSILITSPAERLARVQALQSNGAKVVLDFARFKVVYTGVVSMYDESLGEFRNYNMIEVSAVRISFGEVWGAGRIALLAKNKGVLFESWIFPEGDIQICVNSYKMVADDYNLPRSIGPLNATTLFSDFDPSQPTIVNVYLFQVEVSMEGR